MQLSQLPDLLQQASAYFAENCLPSLEPVHAASSYLTGRLNNQDSSRWMSANRRHHLLCLVLASPLSLLDATFHTFWCNVKISILIVRGSIYYSSSGRHGHFLENDVSIRQVAQHAKKAGLFVIGFLFGSIVGAANPNYILRFHDYFSLTAIPPEKIHDLPKEKQYHFFPSNLASDAASSHLKDRLFLSQDAPSLSIPATWQPFIQDRLTCIALASPLCAVDALHETFWFLTKTVLYLPARALYASPLRRFGETLIDNTSEVQIIEHARKAGLFAIGALFGSILGFYSPAELIRLQEEHTLTAPLPPPPPSPPPDA